MNQNNHISILNSSLFGIKKGILFLILFSSVIFFSCLTEDELGDLKYQPVMVGTTAITSITTTSAVSGGNLTSKQSRNIVSRGICWATNPNPTITGNKTTDSKGLGTFTSTISGLLPGTKYYIRAYAVDNLETAYGNEVSFTTLAMTSPTVTTTVISAITATTATSGGVITSNGNTAITAQGVCWGTTDSPTIAGSKTSDSIKYTTYASAITGLTPNTKYYVRAYATNNVGTAYGSQLSFTTNAIGLPVLTTTAVSAITITTATGGGNVISDGGLTLTVRGICWSTSTAPTTALTTKTTDGTGTGIFVSLLTGLASGTKYYVRAYATNSMGTTYGNEVSFTTAIPITTPILTTTAISSITMTTATGGGNITSDGGATVTGRGICWSTNTSPTIADSKTTNGTGNGIFSSAITGLTAGTKYYVRAYATNSIGTAYGDEVSFTTSVPTAPTLSTTAISAITTTTASGGGNVSSDGGAAVTARGICWSTTTTPTIANSKTSDGTGTGIFTSSLTGLVESTTYYVRAYATNSAGTAYGDEIYFKTLLPATGTVTDIEGNVYDYLTVGSQTWMAENLKTTKYNDGTTIPLVTDDTAWSNLSTGAYCWYNNDAATNKGTYGALYNWYAVNTAKLAPSGWHVPTDAEWTTLESYVSTHLGASGSVAKALAAKTNWANSSDTGAIGNDLTANNSSGFSALPGGYRDYYGPFRKKGNGGYYWCSSSEGSAMDSYINRYMDSYLSNVVRVDDLKVNGYSVRCIRDY